MNDGVLKVWPEAEFLPTDMAEALRAATTFNGILQGCRLSISSDHLRMSPGRVLILGRLGYFGPDENDTAMTITCPTPSSNNTLYNIVIVCDLRSGDHPLYVDLKTPSYISANWANMTVASDVDFNTNTAQAFRYLTIGSVRVSTAGVPSNLIVDTGTFPEYRYVDNKRYVDRVENLLNNRWTIFNAWMQRLERVKHRTAFFRRNDIVANGITIPANSVATFQFRKEYGTQVIIKPGSGDATLPNPSEQSFIYIYPSGGIVPGTGHQGAGPTPSTTKTYYEGTTVVSSLYEEWQNYGVVGTRIENASGGAQANNCYVQSTYFATSGSAEYLYVVVKNTANAQAKIKLTVTCLYIRNIDYPS